MDRTQIRMGLRYAADKIGLGQEPELVDGVEGLLRKVDEFIEEQSKQINQEVKRANKLDEFGRKAMGEVERLQRELNACEEDKETYRKIVQHFLDEH